MKKLKAILQLVRPHQHLKNAFVLLPLFFGAKLYDADAVSGSFFAFAVFCLAAGAIYIVNDLKDVHEDRRHPVKRFRPLSPYI
ncbi:MAG: hypothetical protein GY864_13920 [Desulfobacterales bacterium]|nr:hypothetical protein [Desulfobacterales bacterium]